VNEARQEMQQEQAERASTIARLEQQRRSLTARGQPTRSVDQQLANLREEQAVIGAAQQFQKATTSEGGLTKAREIDLNELQVNTGWPWLDQAVHHAAENPALLVYKLQSSAYKFSWALIPLSVPFVWMLFLWRRGYRLYDHTVFVTYSIAFMTLLVVALSLVRPILGTDSLSGAALTFIPPWHMYRQLRGAYRLRPLSAIWRTAFLLVFASVAATLFFLLLLTMGLLG